MSTVSLDVLFMYDDTYVPCGPVLLKHVTLYLHTFDGAERELPQAKFAYSPWRYRKFL